MAQATSLGISQLASPTLCIYLGQCIWCRGSFTCPLTSSLAPPHSFQHDLPVPTVLHLSALHTNLPLGGLSPILLGVDCSTSHHPASRCCPTLSPGLALALNSSTLIRSLPPTPIHCHPCEPRCLLLPPPSVALLSLSSGAVLKSKQYILSLQMSPPLINLSAVQLPLGSRVSGTASVTCFRVSSVLVSLPFQAGPAGCSPGFLGLALFLGVCLNDDRVRVVRVSPHGSRPPSPFSRPPQQPQSSVFRSTENLAGLARALPRLSPCPGRLTPFCSRPAW